MILYIIIIDLRMGVDFGTGFNLACRYSFYRVRTVVYAYLVGPWSSLEEPNKK